MTHQRPRTRAEERIAELDVSPQALTDEIDQLRQQLLAAEHEAAESKAGWQRTAADFANYRRRTEQDREQSLGLANEVLLAKLLTIVDDFDRAIANMPAELRDLGWIEGIAAIDRKFDLLLASEGLTPIDAVGKPFDPREHEAVGPGGSLRRRRRNRRRRAPARLSDPRPRPAAGDGRRRAQQQPDPQPQLLN